ncbi:SPW repeat protein [Streptomyces abyssomicinicus]|uniref:SPW repeat protein n=1 Tax=Streptomyces abyssomicinicus TaxID=574929 RepID=UPI00125082A3|nr:SPW repeat protein [Streptomyces abyssomicinicus]
MANVSHPRGDMASHPDVLEMREQYARSQQGPNLGMLAAPLCLVGVYCAASPWILHFTGSQPPMVAHNVIVGAAIAALAICAAANPTRMSGLGWAAAGLGVWMIIAPWVVGTNPDAGVIISSICVGALAICLGAACAALGMRKAKAGKASSRF